MTPSARTCGGCGQCCRLFAIADPALTKPVNVWCPHVAASHHGCTIYATRPRQCQDFICLWLDGAGDDSMRPDKSKVVFTVSQPMPFAPHGFLMAHVDPNQPQAWQQGAAHRFIRYHIEHGKPVIVVMGSRRTILTRDPALQREIMQFVEQHQLTLTEGMHSYGHHQDRRLPVLALESRPQEQETAQGDSPESQPRPVEEAEGRAEADPLTPTGDDR